MAESPSADIRRELAEANQRLAEQIAIGGLDRLDAADSRYALDEQRVTSEEIRMHAAMTEQEQSEPVDTALADRLWHALLSGDPSLVAEAVRRAFAAGSASSARDLLASAIKHDRGPANGAVLQGLGRLPGAQLDPSAARACIRAIFACDDEHGEAELTVAEREVLTDAALALAQRVAEEQRQPADRRALSAALNQSGRVARAKGDSDAARRLHEEALEIAEQLVVDDPSDAAHAWQLWATLTNIGVLSDPASDAGLATHLQALEAARRLYSMPGEHAARADHDLVLSLTNASYAQGFAGDLDSARDTAHEAVDVARRWAAVAADPRRALESMSEALVGLGLLTTRGRDWDAARQYLREALQIARALYAEDPLDGRHSDALITALVGYSSAAMAAGDFEQGFSLALEALRVSTTTSHADPRDLDALAQLEGMLQVVAVAGESIALPLRERGDAEGAGRYLDEAASARRQLLGLNPEDVENMLALANIRVLQGEAALQGGALDDAVAAFREAAHLRASAVDRRPGDLESLDQLAIAHLMGARALESAGETAQALYSYGASAAARRRIVALQPKDTKALDTLGALLLKRGELSLRLHDWEAATTAYQDAAAIYQELIDAEPKEPRLTHRLWQAVQGQSTVALGAGDAQAASDILGTAAGIAHSALQLDPSSGQARDDLWVSMRDRGAAMEALGDQDGALSIRREVTVEMLLLADANPGDPQLVHAAVVSQFGLMARLLDSGRPLDALTVSRDALTRWHLSASSEPPAELVQATASHFYQSGDRASKLGEHEAAIELQAAAVDWSRVRCDLNPGDRQSLADLAAFLHDLGVLRANAGESSLAVKNYREAIGIRERLVAETESDLTVVRGLAASLENLGSELMSQDSDAAHALLIRSLGIRQSDSAAHPDDAEVGRRLAYTQLAVGRVARLKGDNQAAESAFNEALSSARRIAGRHPSDVECSRLVGVALTWVGAAVGDRGDWQAASAANSESFAIAMGLAAQNPGDHQLADDLARAQRNLEAANEARRERRRWGFGGRRG